MCKISIGWYGIMIFIENIYRIFVFKCIVFWVIFNVYDVYIIVLYECNCVCMWFVIWGIE